MGNKRSAAGEKEQQVLTVGHSTLPIEQFIERLRGHHATLLVDVRTIPRSRRNPQFNTEVLQNSLQEVGVGYRHMPALGGLRHPKKDSVNIGWRNDAFRGFADYMQSPAFNDAVEEVIRLARTERVVLMCAEAVPWRCHRSLIADALFARAIPVEHIMSESKRQPHKPTPFANIKGTTITYPEAQLTLPT